MATQNCISVSLDQMQ